VHPSPGFRLPENRDTPIIMVGPGTGIAPFRAFLQERRATRAKGPSWLFFGDQKSSCDYLYEDELARHLSDGSLSRLDLAFSRDQDEKIYVQTRMLQQGKDIWQWLEEGAHFYICGDAKRMAKDVDAALHQIAREQGNLDEAGAKNYIQSLVKSRRYQRDVY
jgi:sulfite reductase (NADPH) flavoprotein alpha-component